MARFTLEALLAADPQARLMTTSQSFEPARLWTDTRSLQPGDFFLPLTGEHFDGHQYVQQACEQGAVGAFVASHQWASHPEWAALPNLIAVPDPLQAYLAVARAYRKQVNPLVIAVTGSSGKTTTKEMLGAAFSACRKTQKTEKNFNNEVGVAQTLLALEPDTGILVVEMGMRGLGQIALLSEAALPDAALVVNVAPAHIGLLGSLEHIAQAKLEVVSGLDPQRGVLVLNADSPPLLAAAAAAWSGLQYTYELDMAQDVQRIRTGQGEEAMRFVYQGTPVTIQAPGLHMVSNALGVLRLGEALGFDRNQLAAGLSRFMPAAGRGEKVQLAGFPSVWLINDAYNANPDSMRASLQTFLAGSPPMTTSGPEKRILVLSGMKELGDFSPAYHAELGRWLAQQPGIDALFCVGEEASWVTEAAKGAPYPVSAVPDVAAVAEYLLAEPARFLAHSCLYLKGSRAYRLEQLPELLNGKGGS